MGTIQLHDKRFKPFLSKTEIQKAIKNLGEVLNKEYKEKNPVFLGVLNGCFLFVADLVREFEGDCEVSFIKLSSYEGTESTGNVRQLIGVNSSLKNRDVLILEDIVDTGNTIKELVRLVNEHQPASVKIATLLYKPKAYKFSNEIPIDFAALEVGNEFLVGYGLDYDELGRNLSDIYIITE